MWKQFEIFGLPGMLPWLGAMGVRVNTTVGVSLGQFGHREGPSIRQCMTTLDLGGGSSFVLDNPDPSPGPVLKQVCSLMV